jgi:single-strand DNA-binding protein
VCITGNITRDAELRATTGGGSVLRFGVAVNDRRKNAQTGEWEDHPNFVDCVMFGKRADALAAYLTKGTKVAVDGKLRYDSWQDRQTGAKRSKLEVVVDDLDFMSRRGDSGGGYQPQQGYQPQPSYQQAPAEPMPQPMPQPRPQAPTTAPAQAPAPDLYDADIPF